MEKLKKFTEKDFEYLYLHLQKKLNLFFQFISALLTSKVEISYQEKFITKYKKIVFAMKNHLGALGAPTPDLIQLLTTNQLNNEVFHSILLIEREVSNRKENKAYIELVNKAYPNLISYDEPHIYLHGQLIVEIKQKLLNNTAPRFHNKD